MTPSGPTAKPPSGIGYNHVAFGISGVIQHKVGVQTAGTIVAINKDAEAPIADFADLMVVGDLFAILPPLIEAVKARKSARGGSLGSRFAWFCQTLGWRPLTSPLPC